MDKLCALCNGLFTLTVSCPKCGEYLADSGLVQDFYDPYSAYLDQEIYEDGYKGYTEECCVHLLVCKNCGFKEYRPMKRFAEEDITNYIPIFT
ncbi:hypothetical protein JCM14036_17830 [Desulfotomaculum defluvii]